MGAAQQDPGLPGRGRRAEGGAAANSQPRGGKKTGDYVYDPGRFAGRITLVHFASSEALCHSEVVAQPEGGDYKFKMEKGATAGDGFLQVPFKEALQRSVDDGVFLIAPVIARNKQQRKILVPAASSTTQGGDSK